ncbi:MAG: hypothetical protein ABR881_25475 [Candidatus Sulfotelmatobacter sp.]|jgi:hypothetical protein
MHARFRDIYSAQVTQFLQLGAARGDRRADLGQANNALSAVTASLKDSRRPLRPDAALFLLLNLNEMVIRPLTDAESPVRVNDLGQRLAEDTRVILAAADAEAGDRRELAASHVLWAAAKVLPQLSLKSYSLWEKD